MGRGNSKSGGGAAGGIKALEMPDGTSIDLSDNPLIYGKDDPGVTGDARTAIDAWEDKRAKAKIEYNMSVDQDGNPIGAEVRGGKGSVRVPVAALGPGAIHTHIHPRDDAGVLGGTFSDRDLYNFANYGVQTYRARAKEGAYSITKGKNFDAAGFKSYVRSEMAKGRGEYEGIMRGLRDKAIKDKSYSWSQYNKDANKAFNAFLVANHNALLTAQQKYDYSYTLERR